MKKRAHIPHNYETAFEIHQRSLSRLQMSCAATLEKQSFLSQETTQLVEKPLN